MNNKYDVVIIGAGAAWSSGYVAGQYA